MVNVSWHDARKICEWLSKVTEKEWRLPTCEEWETAVGTSKYPWRDYFPPNWYDGDYAVAADGKHDPAKVGVDGSKGAAPVGSFKMNVLGFYDLGRDVQEWMWDMRGEKTGKRVLRGGHWGSNADFCEVALRFGDNPERLGSNNGFRIALSSVPEG